MGVNQRRSCGADLELAGIHNKGDIRYGEGRLGYVGGNDDLADPKWGNLESFPLFLGGDRGMQGEHPLASLTVGCVGSQLVKKTIDLTHACTNAKHMEILIQFNTAKVSGASALAAALQNR